MFDFEPARAIRSIEELRHADVLGDIKKVGTGSSDDDRTHQFCVFPLGSDADAPTLRAPSEVSPSIEGSDDQPDVLVKVELGSFHIAASEEIDKDSRATLRLVMGADKQASPDAWDHTFWTIAAGLKLYEATTGRTSAKDLSFSSQHAFGTPIEVKGGLSQFSFEVAKHPEPTWYQKLFRFVTSEPGGRLVSLLGFPKLTLSAVRAVDALLERLTEEEPLFESDPMTLALSSYGRDKLSSGNDRVSVGVLSKGYNILVRWKDFDLFNEMPLVYHPTHKRLIPEGVSESEFMSGSYDDPLEDVTYAVCRVGLKETSLNPTVDF